MSLTFGSIPVLGRPTGGELNIELPDTPAHLLYLHDIPERVRGEVDGVTVVDSTKVKLLHETRILPRWYIPREDVLTDLLEPSETVTHCPYKGDARYFHLRVGDRLIEDTFWEYPDPVPGAPAFAGLLSAYLEKFDRWLEEDEEMLGHPRDPFHRVDARRSSRRVVVRAGDVVIADSSNPVAVNETGLPTRWYIPEGDIDMQYLQPTDTESLCPYKGKASYWTVTAGGQTFADAAWAYPDPLPEATPALGHISFLADGVTTTEE